MQRKNYIKGAATLELLIAFTLLILTITAVMLLVGGGQSVSVDTETSIEATSKAQAMLEKARADAKQDFDSVNSITTTEQSGSLFYTKKLEVEVDPFDFNIKKITSIIAWTTAGRDLFVSLTTLLTNPAGAGNICNPVLSDTEASGWKNPKIKNSVTDFATLVGVSGTYLITDVDAYQGKLYITIGNTTNKTDPTFFVFDITRLINNQANSLIASIDNSTLSAGLNAVAVAGNYAYVANANVVLVGQLQVIDLSTNPPKVVKSLRLSASAGVGNSIFYKNGYVYLGLTNSGSGPEFYIIDVRNPLIPTAVIGGVYIVGNDINAIAVKGSYAYLATPNNQELQILNISNPSVPVLAGNFSVGAGNGKNIYIADDKLYFGKTTGSGNDLFILNNINPNVTLPELGGLDVGASVNDVLVRDYLAFLLTNNQLKILNVNNPGGITQWASPVSLPGAGTSGGSSIDCEGNYLYVGTKTNGGLYVISP